MDWQKIKQDNDKLNLPEANIPVLLWDNKIRGWFLSFRLMVNELTFVGDVWVIFPGQYTIPVLERSPLTEITHWVYLQTPKDILS